MTASMVASHREPESEFLDAKDDLFEMIGRAMVPVFG
jgi:hypothetical protein